MSRKISKLFIVLSLLIAFALLFFIIFSESIVAQTPYIIQEVEGGKIIGEYELIDSGFILVYNEKDSIFVGDDNIVIRTNKHSLVVSKDMSVAEAISSERGLGYVYYTEQTSPENSQIILKATGFFQASIGGESYSGNSVNSEITVRYESGEADEKVFPSEASGKMKIQARSFTYEGLSDSSFVRWIKTPYSHLLVDGDEGEIAIVSKKIVSYNLMGDENFENDFDISARIYKEDEKIGISIEDGGLGLKSENIFYVLDERLLIETFSPFLDFSSGGIIYYEKINENEFIPHVIIDKNDLIEYNGEKELLARIYSDFYNLRNSNLLVDGIYKQGQKVNFKEEFGIDIECNRKNEGIVTSITKDWVVSVDVDGTKCVVPLTGKKVVFAYLLEDYGRICKGKPEGTIVSIDERFITVSVDVDGISEQCQFDRTNLRNSLEIYRDFYNNQERLKLKAEESLALFRDYARTHKGTEEGGEAELMWFSLAREFGFAINTDKYGYFSLSLGEDQFACFPTKPDDWLFSILRNTEKLYFRTKIINGVEKITDWSFNENENWNPVSIGGKPNYNGLAVLGGDYGAGARSCTLYIPKDRQGLYPLGVLAYTGIHKDFIDNIVKGWTFKEIQVYVDKQLPSGEPVVKAQKNRIMMGTGLENKKYDKWYKTFKSDYSQFPDLVQKAGIIVASGYIKEGNREGALKYYSITRDENKESAYSKQAEEAIIRIENAKALEMSSLLVSINYMQTYKDIRSQQQSLVHFQQVCEGGWGPFGGCEFMQLLSMSNPLKIGREIATYESDSAELKVYEENSRIGIEAIGYAKNLLENNYAKDLKEAVDIIRAATAGKPGNFVGDTVKCRKIKYDFLPEKGYGVFPIGEWKYFEIKDKKIRNGRWVYAILPEGGLFPAEYQVDEKEKEGEIQYVFVNAMSEYDVGSTWILALSAKDFFSREVPVFNILDPIEAKPGFEYYSCIGGGSGKDDGVLSYIYHLNLPYRAGADFYRNYDEILKKAEALKCKGILDRITTKHSAFLDNDPYINNLGVGIGVTILIDTDNREKKFLELAEKYKKDGNYEGAAYLARELYQTTENKQRAEDAYKIYEDITTGSIYFSLEHVQFTSIYNGVANYLNVVEWAFWGGVGKAARLGIIWVGGERFIAAGNKVFGTILIPARLIRANVPGVLGKTLSFGVGMGSSLVANRIINDAVVSITGSEELGLMSSILFFASLGYNENELIESRLGYEGIYPTDKVVMIRKIATDVVTKLNVGLSGTRNLKLSDKIFIGEQKIDSTPIEITVNGQVVVGERYSTVAGASRLFTYSGDISLESVASALKKQGINSRVLYGKEGNNVIEILYRQGTTAVGRPVYLTNEKLVDTAVVGGMNSFSEKQVMNMFSSVSIIIEGQNAAKGTQLALIEKPQPVTRESIFVDDPNADVLIKEALVMHEGTIIFEPEVQAIGGLEAKLPETRWFNPSVLHYKFIPSDILDIESGSEFVGVRDKEVERVMVTESPGDKARLREDLAGKTIAELLEMRKAGDFFYFGADLEFKPDEVIEFTRKVAVNAEELPFLYDYSSGKFKDFPAWRVLELLQKTGEITDRGLEALVCSSAYNMESKNPEHLVVAMILYQLMHGGENAMSSSLSGATTEKIEIHGSGNSKNVIIIIIRIKVRAGDLIESRIPWDLSLDEYIALVDSGKADSPEVSGIFPFKIENPILYKGEAVISPNVAYEGEATFLFYISKEKIVDVGLGPDDSRAYIHEANLEKPDVLPLVSTERESGGMVGKVYKFSGSNLVVKIFNPDWTGSNELNFERVSRAQEAGKLMGRMVFPLMIKSMINKESVGYITNYIKGVKYKNLKPELRPIAFDNLVIQYKEDWKNGFIQTDNEQLHNTLFDPTTGKVTGHIDLEAVIPVNKLDPRFGPTSLEERIEDLEQARDYVEKIIAAGRIEILM